MGTATFSPTAFVVVSVVSSTLTFGTVVVYVITADEIVVQRKNGRDADRRVPPESLIYHPTKRETSISKTCIPEQ